MPSQRNDKTATYAHLAANLIKRAATKISDRLALAPLGTLDKPAIGEAKQSGTSIDNEADEAAAA
jgi:hypothetical protein